MQNLNFTYGVMGSAKTAHALMRKYEFEQQDKKVLLLKPLIATRDGDKVTKSRIGLQSDCVTFTKVDNLCELLKKLGKFDIIMVDEVQFATSQHIDQLRLITIINDLPVYTYGLKTDFQLKLFEGSKRLIEIANEFTELKLCCKCGKDANVNARIADGKIVLDGEKFLMGSNDKYKAMCYECYYRTIEQQNLENALKK